MNLPAGLVARRLVATDLAEVIALHRLSRQGIREDLVAHDSDGFFGDHIARSGQILGLFDGDGLAAYGVLGLPGPGDPNFGIDHGLGDAAMARVAHIDGAAVHPRWRGCGLHRHLIFRRVAEAARHGRSIALSTAAPDNVHSLGNLFAAGFAATALKPRFGGWRFLLRLDAECGTQSERGNGGRWLPLSQRAEQAALLAAGWRGVDLDPSPPGRILFRAPPE